MASIPLAGYNSWGTINGVAVAITEWEVNPEVEDLDGTSTESEGFHVPCAGPVKAEVKITGYFDALNNPYAIGEFGIQAGKNVALEIGVSQDNEGVYWDFPAAMVKSCPNKGSVKEKIMFTMDAIGNGEFTYPEGDVGEF